MVESNNAGYNGTGFLNFPTTGGSATFNNINGGTGGAANLAIRFANGASAGARTGLLIVNGSASNITYASTGSWTTWNTMNVTINLSSGTANTIRLESSGQDAGNIDQITVTPNSGGGGSGVIPNGTYRLINRKSLKALDILAGSNGVDYAEQRTYIAANDQKWTFTSVNGNEYRIVNVANGEALDIEGASVSNGARAITATSTGSTSQRWRATATDSGYYTLAAVHSTKALDVSGGATTDGATVIQYTNNAATNQQWSPQAP